MHGTPYEPDNIFAKILRGEIPCHAVYEDEHTLAFMDVMPQSDSLSGTGNSTLAPPGFDVFTVGSGSGQGSIALPRVASSTIATKVLLRSSQTAVLGGLSTDNTTDTHTRIPVLGDISDQPSSGRATNN